MIPFPNISTSPDDADSDPTNELQNISLTANALELENGGSYQSLADSDINVTLYPNPADKFVTIEINHINNTNLGNEKSIVLNDLAGREILREKYSNNPIKMNIDNIENGLYLINIIINDRMVTKKLVIN